MTALSKRNNSIDIFRYICAVLVVVIHTEPFYVGELSFVGVFLKQFFARIAVPFFFVVSGYFFFNKAFRNESVLLRTIGKLVRVYAFWSIPYFLINAWIYHDEGVGLFAFIKKFLFDFFVFGSYYHFWFFPALIYSTVIAFVLYKIFGFRILVSVSVVLYVIGCLGTSYSEAFLSVPVLSDVFAYEYFPNICRIFMTGLPFYVLGGWIVKLKDRVVIKSRCSELVWLLVVCLAFVVEKILLLLMNFEITDPNTFMLYPLIAIIVIILFKHPIEGKENISSKLRICANFIYYIHPAFLLVTDRVFVSFLGHSLHSAWMFVLAVVGLTIIGLLLSKTKFMRNLLS